MNLKKQIGDFGQQLAVEFLRKRGYEVLTENYRTKEGELDIIAQKDGQLAFVEVKTRLSGKYGLPEEAVTKVKKGKMRQAISGYLQEKQINHDNFRLDCIAVEIDKPNKKAFIRHHKSIGTEY